MSSGSLQACCPPYPLVGSDDIAERPPRHRRVETPEARGGRIGVHSVVIHAGRAVLGQLKHQGGLTRLEWFDGSGHLTLGGLPRLSGRLAGVSVCKALHRDFHGVGLREKAAHHHGFPGLNRCRDPIDYVFFGKRCGSGEGRSNNGRLELRGCHYGHPFVNYSETSALQLIELDCMAVDSAHYSYLNASTGLARAASQVWLLTVANATARTPTPASTNQAKPMSMR